MYAFARRPAWIVSHALVVLLVVVLVNLGLWQLRRHDERADRNAAVEARSEQPAIDVAALLDEVDPGSTGEIEYRAGRATGEYLDVTLEIDNRSQDGLPGVWIVGVLDTGDQSVAVLRGFDRRVGGEGADVEPLPAGEVTVQGTVLGFADRSCGTRRDEGGATVGAACLSTAAVEAAVESQTGQPAGELAPVVLRRAAGTGGPSLLATVPLPDLGAGPHLGYAGQWFVFSLVAVVGYPLVLRKVATDRDDSPVAG